MWKKEIDKCKDIMFFFFFGYYVICCYFWFMKYVLYIDCGQVKVQNIDIQGEWEG